MTCLVVPCFASCAGTPPEVECSTDKPCADGKVCENSVCVTPGGDGGPGFGVCPGTFGPASPPNLLGNPDFECGDPPSGWTTDFNGTLTAEAANPQSGARAAKVTSKVNSSGVISIFPVDYPVQSPGAKTYCAAAWVRGTDPATGHVEITEVTSSSGIVRHKFSAPLHAAWQRLKVDAATTATSPKLSVRVYLENPKVGDFLVVDAVELWVSAGGKCLER